MPGNYSTAKSIFIQAIQSQPQDRWPSFLDEACGGDAELRGEVELLLEAHVEMGSIRVAGVTETMESIVPEQPEISIGPYKLLQELGRGGMGVVYLAEQTEPVERRVALKVIKPGMDSRQVIARFAAERQALALMDHPNIAKVLDASTTKSGRPYFVMELVRGVPITRYCDDKQMSPRQRLNLFIPVCHAVQHAHQKGVIHRDLKPSNVLVAQYDGMPTPKVIDFGVAKATSQKLTEKTMFTQFGQIVGTLEYMSPEQAEINQLDIDTRSDVYSLGVLLYELLTGVTPFERRRLQSAAFDEMLRIIREEEPPRPSIRLSSMETLPTVASNRRTDPRKLSAFVRGELDWIVMKALEKDRSRRYETANGFAADVERYLKDEAVEACPPSAGYRAWKFVRRNKGPATATAALVLSLIAGIVGTGVGYVRSEQARESLKGVNVELADSRAQVEKTNQALTKINATLAKTNTELQASRDELEEANNTLQSKNEQLTQVMFHQGIAAAMSGNIERTQKSIKNVEAAGGSGSQSDFLNGLLYWTRGDSRLAARHLEKAADSGDGSLAVRAMLATAYLGIGDPRFTSVSTAISQMRPTTAEDFLFSAMNSFVFTPELAVTQAQTSLAIHDSAIARLVHALVLQEMALKTRNPQLLDLARQELGEGSVELPADHEFLNNVRLFVMMAIIALAPAESETSTDARRVASRVAGEFMAADIGMAITAWGVAHFYDLLEDDPQSAQEAWNRMRTLDQGDQLRPWYAAFRLRHDGPQAAIEAFRESPTRGRWSLAMEVQLLALQPDHREEAAATWKEIDGEWSILVPWLLGDHESLKAVGSQWRTASDRPWLVPRYDYMLGKTSAKEYLESAASFGDEIPANYFIAMKSLRTDRDKAKHHFQAVIDSKYYKHWVYGWALGYLAQMERDPDWPELPN